MSEARCQFCGVEIEPMCDVCERHAMTQEQLADYYLEIWPELGGSEEAGGE